MRNANKNVKGRKTITICWNFFAEKEYMIDSELLSSFFPSNTN